MGSPKDVYAERKHHKLRQGVIQFTLALLRRGVVGFIEWAGLMPDYNILLNPRSPYPEKT
jgi:hypothetical protein